MKRVLAALLCCVLLVSLLTGCKGSDSNPTDTGTEPTVTPVPTPTPIPTPLVPVEPDAVVTQPNTDGEQLPTEIDVEIQGMAETVEMTAINGSFASVGGPDFTVLVDGARYQVNDMGGYCYITLRTGMSGDVYAELGFRANCNAESLGTAFLKEYGTMASVSDLGTETLGSNTVHHVRGETIQNVFDAYLLDTIDGCMTMVISSTADTVNHHTRLLASLETLTIS